MLKRLKNGNGKNNGIARLKRQKAREQSLDLVKYVREENRTEEENNI